MLTICKHGDGAQLWGYIGKRERLSERASRLPTQLKGERAAGSCGWRRKANTCVRVGYEVHLPHSQDTARPHWHLKTEATCSSEPSGIPWTTWRNLLVAMLVPGSAAGLHSATLLHAQMKYSFVIRRWKYINANIFKKQTALITQCFSVRGPRPLELRCNTFNNNSSIRKTRWGWADVHSGNALNWYFGKGSVWISVATQAILSFFHRFSPSLQAKAGIAPRSGHDRFLPNPLKFITH
jgi:hypothetical protein